MTESQVATTETVWDDDTLSGIKTFDQMMEALAENGVEVTDITEYGSGFARVEKDELVNVGFVILDYKFSDKGDYGDFVILRIMTSDNRKCIVTDGSTGILEQMRGVQKRGKSQGILVKRGFTRSDYTYIDDKGKPTPASTYYLSM